MTEVSNGFLPLSALSHAEPTAVGELDLGQPLAVRSRTRAGSACRDQLVLVRLHAQPVGIIHLDRPPGTETPVELAHAIWTGAAAQIIDHVLTCGCTAPPGGSEQLLDGLGGESVCPGRIPERPPGHAAVIVATLGRTELLERTLTSMLAMECSDYEVIVVDNRPATSATRELVTRLAVNAPLRYVAEPKQGASIARNTGVQAAGDAAFVAFTDDDVVLDRHWLSWLLTPFGEPSVDAVTGMVLPLELSSPAQKSFELYAGFGKGVKREAYDLGEHRGDHRFLYPYWGGMFGSGNSMAFRRSRLIAIGGFDPALGPGMPSCGGEDTAAFSDIILRNGRLVYEPKSLCWHEHRTDDESLRRQVHSYGVGFTASLWRLARRDPRFARAALRSIPIIARAAVDRHRQRSSSEAATDLARLEMHGRLVGPWRYEQSRRIARTGPRTNSSVRGE